MIVEAASPVSAREFARLMVPFEPFEVQPSIAVAVSGGRDSLALAILTRDWVAPRGGQLLALIVDHGLRPEAVDEAQAAQSILKQQGIEATILTWRGDKPRTGLQSAARHYRYGLLRAECRRRGILHLLLAHQADDQVETLAMRAAHGSGPDGLSGMAAAVELRELRLLRPLLGVARARLTTTLRLRAVPWLDDPSNLDPRFERVRLRSGPPLRTGGTKPGVRQARENAVAEVAVALLEVDESGGVAFDRDEFAALGENLQARLLSRIVQGVGGRNYPPRQERLAAACRRLGQPARPGKSGRAQDFTLSGCRLVLRQLSQSRRQRWIVRPENGRNERQPLLPGPFFACDALDAPHVECKSTPTDIDSEPLQP